MNLKMQGSCSTGGSGTGQSGTKSGQSGTKSKSIAIDDLVISEVVLPTSDDDDFAVQKVRHIPILLPASSF